MLAINGVTKKVRTLFYDIKEKGGQT